MIDPAARFAVRELETKLKPFIAKRVRSAADVDDIVQDVFLRMQRGLGTLREEERFGAWVYQVARNAIIDHQRARIRHPWTDGEPPEPVSEEGEAEGKVACELATYLTPFVATLPSPYREAIALTEIEGLTQKEAADMLGVSLSGMKSRVQRGRERLRQALESCCQIALDARGKVMACEPKHDGQRPDGCC